MICPNCRKYYNDAHIFCPFCKTKKPKKFCPKCGNVGEVDEKDNFCTLCGSKLKTIGYEKIKLEKELKESIKKLKTENSELKQENVIIENVNIELKEQNKKLKQTSEKQEEKILKIENELNNIEKANKKLKTETRNLEKQNKKVEKKIKLPLKLYLNTNYNDSKYDNFRKSIINNIDSLEITTIKQIDTEIERLKEEYKLKLEREKLISYVNNKRFPNDIKTPLINEINNGKIKTKEQVDERKIILEKEKYYEKLMKTINQSDICEDLKKTIINSIDMEKILDYDYFSRERRKINLIQTIYGPDHPNNEPPYLFTKELKKIYENKNSDEEEIQKAIRRVKGRLINTSKKSPKPSGRLRYKPRWY